MTINKGFVLYFNTALLSSSSIQLETLHIEKMLEEKNDNLLRGRWKFRSQSSLNLNQSEPEVLETEITDRVTAIPAEDNTAAVNEADSIANQPTLEAKNQTALDAIAETNPARK